MITKFARSVAVAVVLCTLSPLALAMSPGEIFKDPQKEARARELTIADAVTFVDEHLFNQPAALEPELARAAAPHPGAARLLLRSPISNLVKSLRLGTGWHGVEFGRVDEVDT